MGDGSREVRKLGGLELDDVEGRLHFFGEVVCIPGSLISFGWGDCCACG